jgi:DNA-binding PadR family transcriptional regulator
MTPRGTKPQDADAAPLSPVEWQILLALADGPKHGYGVLLEIEEREGERVRVLPGSLYRALHRLEKERLLAEQEAPGDDDGDQRRRVFALTSRGRRVAEAEASRLAAELRTARRKGLLVERGGA